jgi:hypothetical protein
VPPQKFLDMVCPVFVGIFSSYKNIFYKVYFDLFFFAKKIFFRKS